MPAVIENISPVSNLRIEFPEKEAGLQVHQVFISEGLRGVLEGKDYCRLDVLLVFLTSFLEKCLQFQ